MEKIQSLGIPLIAGSNIIASPLMKVIFSGDESSWGELPDDFDHSTLEAVRGKYLILRDSGKITGSMTVLEKLNEVFTIEEGRKYEYLEWYEKDKREICLL